MRYFATRKKHTATVLALLLLAAAFIFSCLAALPVGWKGLFQVLTLASLVAMIQIAQRYLLSGYEYILDPSEELLTYNRLTVIRVVGQRRTSVFMTPLSSLTQVIPYRKLSEVKKEFGCIGTRMDFSADLLPPVSYLLLFEVHGEQSLVRLQCDETFAEALRERAGI